MRGKRAIEEEEGKCEWKCRNKRNILISAQYFYTYIFAQFISQSDLNFSSVRRQLWRYNCKNIREILIYYMYATTTCNSSSKTRKSKVINITRDTRLMSEKRWRYFLHPFDHLRSCIDRALNTKRYFVVFLSIKRKSYKYIPFKSIV